MYWFSDANNTVLYVGKAKNLKNRVRSYAQLGRLSARIHQLSTTASQLKFQVLASELEALLTEAQLIRTYQPQYNVLLKDDKSPLYIHITSEKYPKVLRVRKKEIITRHLTGTLLGPFQSGYKVNEVLKLVRPIFPWCNGSSKPSRACFYHHLQLCSGACIGAITPEAYQEMIGQLELFLKGKKHDLVHDLQRQLTQAVNSEAFENAAVIRDRIALIEAVTHPQKKLSPELSTPALMQELKGDGLKYLSRVLNEHQGVPIEYPLNRIEGYDVSNTFGTLASVAMVTFVGGESATDEYRLFNIRSLNTPNDYHMMKEALTRRQNHPEWGRPDLVVIDGGKGQVRAALSVWDWATPLIGIAKHPDRLVIPRFRPRQMAEADKRQLLNTLTYDILTLPGSHPALQLIQQIRDESHRFSKKQHSRRRTKAMLRE